MSFERGPADISQGALDALSTALFGVFVVLLFAGFLNVTPNLPYAMIALVPLLGSLASLGWANASLDRSARSSVVPPAGP